MKLTPQQRIEAYGYALKQVKEESHGMCWSLDEMLTRFTGIDTLYMAETVSYYDEFKTFDDDMYPKYGSGLGYWFPFDEQGNKTREIILLFCIEMATDEWIMKKDENLNKPKPFTFGRGPLDPEH